MGSQPSRPSEPVTRGYPTDRWDSNSNQQMGYSQNMMYNQQQQYPQQQQQQRQQMPQQQQQKPEMSPQSLTAQVERQLAQSDRTTTQPPEKDASTFNQKTLLNKQQFADNLDRLLTLEDQIGSIERTSPSVNLKVQDNYMNFLNRGINTIVHERSQLQSGMNTTQIGWNDGLSDDARQRLSLHNAMRIDKLEHEMQHYTTERNKCAAEMQKLQTQLTQLRRLQDERDELWQDLFNGEEYGSVTEYFYVERLKNLIAKHQVAALADYLWSTAQHFAFLSKTHLEKVLQSWRKIPQSWSNAGEARELAMTSRDDLAQAIMSIKSLKLYLADYKIPYFDEAQLRYLDQSYQHILSDAENPERHASVGQFYETILNRALALHTWTSSVMKEQIKPDLRKVAQEITDDRVKLNAEKMKLLQAMIDESFESDRKLQEKLNTYKRFVDNQTQAETAARAESSTSTDQTALTNAQVAALLSSDAKTGNSVYIAPGAAATSETAAQAANATSESASQAASTTAAAGVSAAPTVASVSTSAGVDSRNAEAGGVPTEVAVLPSRDEIFSNIDKLWKQHDEGVNDLQQLTQASRSKANAELQAKLQARRQGAKQSTS